MTAGYKPLICAYLDGELVGLSTVERLAAVTLALLAAPSGLIDVRAGDLAELIGTTADEARTAMGTLNRLGVLRWSVPDSSQRLSWGERAAA